METTTLIAASRQATLRREMQTIANNLANVNTTGFKADRMMFVEHLVKSEGGERLIDPKLAFVRDIATRVDFSEGPLEATGNELDVAIRGEGFFVVQTENGDERFTRSGRFQLNADGELTTPEGNRILGEGNQPIVVGPTDVDIEITPEGTISSRNGEIGQLRIVRFENLQNVDRESGGLINTDQQPLDAPDVRVVQGSLEGSNVSPVVELGKMIQLQRTFDAVRSFVSREDERQRSLVRELLLDT